MRSAGTYIAGALALFFMGAEARAQMPVIDPANLAQSLIQAEHALAQIDNQIRQIEQQTQMLKRNPLQLSGELSRSIDEAQSLFATAQGVAFQANRVGEDIRALYPETWEEFDLDDVLARSKRWRRESRASLETAMRAEARAAAAVQASSGRVQAALDASAAAEGQTSATQAGNQLLGVNAVQLAEIQALLAAQGRALAIERMERLAREERSIEIQRRAFPTQTQPAPPPARPAF